MKHHFLWLDLETTGLDPRKDLILEWAAVLANDGIDGDMSTVHHAHSVIQPHTTIEELHDKMDPFMLDMHTRNGLLREIENRTGHTLAEAEAALIAMASPLLTGPRSVVLAGSTVAFDRGFLMEHMPRLAELLSHRCFDVSTLKMAERAWADLPFKKAEAHRALPDVIESLIHAREIRERRWPKP